MTILWYGEGERAARGVWKSPEQREGEGEGEERGRRGRERERGWLAYWIRPGEKQEGAGPKRESKKGEEEDRKRAGPLSAEGAQLKRGYVEKGGSLE